MSYTKGPWAIETDGDAGPGLRAFNLWKGEDTVVGADSSGSALIAKPEDAYLISKAPEMYEALAYILGNVPSEADWGEEIERLIRDLNTRLDPKYIRARADHMD